MLQSKPETSTRDLRFLPGVHATVQGELSFVSPEAQVQRTAELLGAEVIVAVVSAPGPSVRGRLAERIDDVIERELAARGAPSPYLTEWSSMPEGAEARLADQLFRARTVGAAGIALAMGSLARIAHPTLTPEDSEMLRVLKRATGSVPLVVMIDDGDVQLDAYAPPKPLGCMLEAAALPAPTEEAYRRRDKLVEALAPRAPFEVVVATGDVAVGPEDSETTVDAPVREIAAEATTSRVLDEARPGSPAAARRRATAGIPVSGPSDYWRSWAVALAAARGPQPLAAFERLFIDSYMPLANAIASGAHDPRAIRAHDDFRQGFERSYTDAFAAFGATARRPRLVMDAFDIASKLARLHHARSSQVLVVDSMRYDLGCLVRDRIAERASGAAALTHESILWSALPTTTFRQLETLARGMDALRERAPDEPTESLRGVRAESVRRLRVGSREMYKLDVVPAMLEALVDPSAGADAGPAHVVEAMGGIASSVADGILRHLRGLGPRTLLFVVGDHGFTIDRKGRVTQGGASPEEVLVPCFAYLVADLH